MTPLKPDSFKRKMWGSQLHWLLITLDYLELKRLAHILSFKMAGGIRTPTSVCPAALSTSRCSIAYVAWAFTCLGKQTGQAGYDTSGSGCFG